MAQEEDAKTGQAEAAQPAEPAQGQGTDAQPKGGPDWRRAAEDYKAQRDEARQRVEDLTGQLDKLKTDVEGLKTADDVQRAVDEALAKANADFDAAKGAWAEREKALTVSNQLAEQGCIDCDALMSHVDMAGVTVRDGKAEGIDVGALRESYPYLFGRRAQSGATDARPEGAADGGLDARIDRAFGAKGE